MIKFISALLAAPLAMSCASNPPPTDNMASAIAAVHGAQVAVAAAGQVPEAALQLKRAEEQVVTAREMIERGDNERANYMTLRAFNDAELAVALARQHQARQAAEAAKRGSEGTTAGPNVDRAEGDDEGPTTGSNVTRREDDQ